MPNLSTYTKKFGKREGRKRYNAYHMKYRKAHKAQLNEAQRHRRNAVKQELLALRKLSPEVA